MSLYRAPADVWVTCDWRCHKDRPNGGSPEPGSDYATAYSTNLEVAGDGVVSVVDWDNSGGEGRRLSIDLDDGRHVSYIHLSTMAAWVGQRVSRGQTGVMWSGASGHGDDWYYDPHVHVTLHERPGMPYRDSIDFELHVGEPPPPPPEERELLMAYSIVPLTDGSIYLVSLVNGNRARVEQPGHVTLLQRVKENNSDDTMFPDELSIVNGYLDRLRGTPPAADPASHPLVTPAWIGGFFLGLIGLVEVVRFVVDIVS